MAPTHLNAAQPIILPFGTLHKRPMLNTDGMVDAVEAHTIATRRLHNQGVEPLSLDSPTAVATRLLAVQAQDLFAAKWAIGARLDEPRIQLIDAAIDEKRIVRSWPMRGTLHFVQGHDLAWMLELTTPRLLQQAKARHTQLGLSSHIFDKARTIATEALSGERSLSREEFQNLLEQNGISTDAGRGYHIIWLLAQTGTLCWGPTEGTAQRLVLLGEWVQHPRRLERDEALGEFVARYFAGHGPATLKDFVWWSKLTVAEAKIGLAVAQDRLVAVHHDDAVYWQSAESLSTTSDATPRPRSPQTVALLPAFDEYFLGYQNREFAAELAHHQRIVPGKNGVFQPIVLVNGRVAATWKRKAIGNTALDITIEPFTAFTRTQQAAVRRQANRFAHFLGLTLRELHGFDSTN